MENNVHTSRSPVIKRKITLYNKGDFDKIKDEIYQFRSEIDTDSLSADILWNLFQSKLELKLET